MIRSLLAAFTMLTILPAGGFCPSERELRRAVTFFPVVGLVLGALFYGICCCSGRHGILAAAVLTILPEILTKGLHLDGLADTADGFLSGRDREKKLEIMRDSRIGTMGVFAIVALLLCKFAVFCELGPRPGIAGMMFLNGRTAILFHIASSRYARPAGLGGLWFRDGKPVAGMILGTVLCLVCGWFADGWPGMAVNAVIIAVFPILWSQVTRHVIGGATGDTIGACEELTEVLTPLIFLWIMFYIY